MTVGPFYVTIEGGGDMRAQADDFVERVADVLEGVVVRRGAAPA
jgi:hypothetical protein